MDELIDLFKIGEFEEIKLQIDQIEGESVLESCQLLQKQYLGLLGNYNTVQLLIQQVVESQMPNQYIVNKNKAQKLLYQVKSKQVQYEQLFQLSQDQNFLEGLNLQDNEFKKFIDSHQGKFQALSQIDKQIIFSQDTSNTIQVIYLKYCVIKTISLNKIQDKIEIFTKIIKDNANFFLIYTSRLFNFVFQQNKQLYSLMIRETYFQKVFDKLFDFLVYLVQFQVSNFSNELILQLKDEIYQNYFINHNFQDIQNQLLSFIQNQPEIKQWDVIQDLISSSTQQLIKLNLILFQIDNIVLLFSLKNYFTPNLQELIINWYVTNYKLQKEQSNISIKDIHDLERKLEILNEQEKLGLRIIQNIQQ